MAEKHCRPFTSFARLCEIQYHSRLPLVENVINQRLLPFKATAFWIRPISRTRGSMPHTLKISDNPFADSCPRFKRPILMTLGTSDGLVHVVSGEEQKILYGPSVQSIY
ncbi:hypothetical protein BJX63DRAFT_182675 [Aspergillus granulosus]|uniref:Uncharacterized protein n=1 Tax=Aspergillus granulosus TaxID=176169 RepID=A0ABR4I2W7_9EURO